MCLPKVITGLQDCSVEIAEKALASSHIVKPIQANFSGPYSTQHQSKRERMYVVSHQRSAFLLRSQARCSNHSSREQRLAKV